MMMAEKPFNYLGWGARQAGKGCWLLDLGLGKEGSVPGQNWNAKKGRCIPREILA